jgi:hypothetical protein
MNEFSPKYRSIDCEEESKFPRLEALKWFLRNNHKSHFETFEKFSIWTHCDLNPHKISRWVEAFHKRKKAESTKSTEPKKRKFHHGKVERGTLVTVVFAQADKTYAIFLKMRFEVSLSGQNGISLQKCPLCQKPQ